MYKKLKYIFLQISVPSYTWVESKYYIKGRILSVYEKGNLENIFIRSLGYMINLWINFLWNFNNTEQMNKVI